MNPEQKFDWIEFRRLSEHIYENLACFPNKEACQRTIISRSYYAVFCLTRNFVKERFGERFSSDEHYKLQDFLKKKSGNFSKIGSKLEKLHDLRKKADYHDYFSLDQSLIKSTLLSLRFSKDILDLLA